MRKYYQTKQEIDKFLEELIRPYIENQSLDIIDVCCGLGHILNILQKISPNSRLLGIDETDYLISEARILNKNIDFKIANAYHLEMKKTFDICINWKTLSWLKYYKKMLKSLFKITRKHIFVSSLFYDGDIDFQTRVIEYNKEQKVSRYNVYSYPRFEEYCYDLGAKTVQVYDFKIDIDLARSSIDDMGTFTYRLENGERLQVSGTVLMPWKIIRIDL